MQHKAIYISSSFLKISIALLLLLLGACRLPIVVDGKGVVYGEISKKVYAEGYVFDINSDFEEVFWPVPAPGYSFHRWNVSCPATQIRCSLVLHEELWSKDVEVPLDVSYTPGYNGPLKLVDYGLYWLEQTQTLSVPANSIVVEGAADASALRYFMAPLDMGLVIPGVLRGADYEFKLPPSGYRLEDFWLFVSGVDSEGVLASHSFSLGYADQLAGAPLQVAVDTSPWAQVLSRCTTASDPFALCGMDELPFLGSVQPNPSIDNIMQRTLVSHPWMSNRFRDVLAALPLDMLRLFKGVTAVVISSQVRPSFYTIATGAIYIDPQDLWLTSEERKQIDWGPDYRSDFGLALDFIAGSDYVDGNEWAWYSSWEWEDGSSRLLSDITRPMAYVLVHELAHANDAVPPALLPPVNTSLTPLDITYKLEPQSPAIILNSTYPLNSGLLYQLGSVLFYGAPPSSLIASLSAAQVGQVFQQDSANGMYAYSSIFEDTATLVEEVLLHHYLGLDRIQFFLDVPLSENPDCADYTLRWGSANRAALPRIKERARLVLSQILDEADVSFYLDALPANKQLTQGIGLCDSVALLSPKPGRNIANNKPGDSRSTQRPQRQIAARFIHDAQRAQAHQKLQARDRSMPHQEAAR